MNLQRIEDEALQLPRVERIKLVQCLVLSLESPSEQELSSDWLIEARRRAEELDSGAVEAVPGEEALKKAKVLI